MRVPNRLSVVIIALVALSCSSRPASVPAPAPEPEGPAPPAGPPPVDRLLPVDPEARRWVDSVVAGMDTRQRAAQLVMVWTWGRYVPESSDDWRRLHRQVTELGVGGIITSIGPPLALADKLNRLQQSAAVPLLVAADMEHGPGMRLDGGTLLPYGLDMGGGTDFPPVMALGAAGDARLAYDMGRVTAVEARAVGVHMDFAPVVDINNNPSNPIINVRSYGGDPVSVAALGAAHTRGLQEHGMLATAKHFPGHGDVEQDTHLVPLILRIDAARADSVELVPYRSAIDADVAGVMTAHIAFPALGDGTLPASLSPRMVDSLLVGELGFRGLVVTDALNMGAIVQRFGGGEAAVLALEAGADILLQPASPAMVVDAVVEAVEDGRIPPARLERSVRKVLEAKTRVGLHRQRTVDLSRIAGVVGAEEHGEVAARIAREGITLARDRENLVPLVPLRDRRVLLVTWTDRLAPFAGRELAAALDRDLIDVRHVALGPAEPEPDDLADLRARANRSDVVLLAVDARVRAGGGAGSLDPDLAAAFAAIAARRPAILISLGNPYVVQSLPDIGTYLLGWSGGTVGQTAVADALLGRAPITGSLPIAIPPLLRRGDGLRRIPPSAAPPDAGQPGPGAAPAVEDRGQPGPVELETGAWDTAVLDSIDGAIESAIAHGVTPGAVVAVGSAHESPRIRAFGRTDWNGDTAVTDSTVWDLASLTKVVGTTTALMTLVDRGRIDLDAPLSRALPEWPTSPERDRVTARRLLTHTAGFLPFIRYWDPSEGALRGRDAYVSAIIERGPDNSPGHYAYSDLGAILMGATVEAVADTSLDAYLEDQVFRPLHMADTGFNPRGSPPEPVAPGGPGVLDPAPDQAVVADTLIPLARIAPTEVDTTFRHTHVHGFVHDENAYAMGGVAGHAGLFSTAPDLARFARMMLRAGRGDDARIASPETVARFVAEQPGTNRALGWDAAAGTRIAEPFSGRAFGHTGFTGTSLWMDPERDLYVVLLTNRVNPTRAQSGIGDLRRRVHELAVRARERPRTPRDAGE